MLSSSLKNSLKRKIETVYLILKSITLKISLLKSVTLKALKTPEPLLLKFLPA